MDLDTLSRKMKSIVSGQKFSLTYQQQLNIEACFNKEIRPVEGSTFWRMTESTPRVVNHYYNTAMGKDAIASGRARNSSGGDDVKSLSVNGEDVDIPAGRLFKSAGGTMLRVLYDKTLNTNGIRISYELRNQEGNAVSRWAAKDIPNINQQCIDKYGVPMFTNTFLREADDPHFSLYKKINVKDILDIHSVNVSDSLEQPQKKPINEGFLRFILDSCLPMPERFCLPEIEENNTLTEELLTEEERRYINSGKIIGLNITPTMARKLSGNRGMVESFVKREKLDRK